MEDIGSRWHFVLTIKDDNWQTLDCHVYDIEHNSRESLDENHLSFNTSFSNLSDTIDDDSVQCTVNVRMFQRLKGKDHIFFISFSFFRPFFLSFVLSFFFFVSSPPFFSFPYPFFFFSVCRFLLKGSRCWAAAPAASFAALKREMYSMCECEREIIQRDQIIFIKCPLITFYDSGGKK